MGEPLINLERIFEVGKRFMTEFTIEAAVGDWSRGAKNRPADVRTLQMLLEYASKKLKNAKFDPNGIDGKIARNAGRSSTVKAIHAFQRTLMSRTDGVVDPDGRTITALWETVTGTRPVSKDAARSVMRTPHPGEGKPPWLRPARPEGIAQEKTVSILPGAPVLQPSWIGVAEEELGIAEIKGDEHNERVQAYHWATDQLKHKEKMTDERPWCASFVGWVLEQAGFESAESSWSHSYKRWGKGVAKPCIGAVAFMDWGKVYPDKPKRRGKGHVGFVVGKTAAGRIVLLGGNQSGRVRYSAYRRSHIDRFRMPKDFEITPDLYNLPIMKVKRGGGSFEATR